MDIQLHTDLHIAFQCLNEFYAVGLFRIMADIVRLRQNQGDIRDTFQLFGMSFGNMGFQAFRLVYRSAGKSWERYGRWAMVSAAAGIP